MRNGNAQVEAVVASPEVVAAEVSLLAADECLHATPFHHITLLVEKGHSASDSNRLPARLAAGEAGVVRLPLQGRAGGPLIVQGIVVAVEEGGGGGGAA